MWRNEKSLSKGLTMSEDPIQPAIVTKYNPRTNELVYQPALKIFGDLVECWYCDCYPSADTAMEVAEAFSKALTEKENERDQ